MGIGRSSPTVTSDSGHRRKTSVPPLHAEPFGTSSTRIYLSKYKSQNSVFQRSPRTSSTGPATNLLSPRPSHYESVTNNKLSVHLRLIKGDWSHVILKHRYPSLSEEDNNTALEFTLQMRRFIKAKGQKLSESYLYEGVMVIVNSSKNKDSNNKSITSQDSAGKLQALRSRSPTRVRSKSTGTDNSLNPNAGNQVIQFIIHRAVILKSHPKWGAECIKIQIDSPTYLYYQPLLLAFQELYLQQEQSEGNENDIELLITSACNIAKIVCSYMPAARVRREIDQTKIDVRNNPELRYSLKRKSEPIENKELQSPEAQEWSDSENQTSINLSKHSSSPSLSHSKLLQELAEGVKEFQIEENAACMQFTGFLSQSTSSAELSTTEVSENGEEKTLFSSKFRRSLIKRISEEQGAPSPVTSPSSMFSRPRVGSAPPARSRETSKSVFLRFTEARDLRKEVLLAPKHSDSSSSSSSTQSLHVRRPSESFGQSMSTITENDYQAPSSTCVEFAGKIDASKQINLYGKLPDVLVDHGFAPFNIDISLKPTKVK